MEKQREFLKNYTDRLIEVAATAVQWSQNNY